MQGLFVPSRTLSGQSRSGKGMLPVPLLKRRIRTIVYGSMIAFQKQQDRLIGATLVEVVLGQM